MENSSVRSLLEYSSVACMRQSSRYRLSES